MRRDDERGRRRRERRDSPSIESTRFVPALPIKRRRESHARRRRPRGRVARAPACRIRSSDDGAKDESRASTRRAGARCGREPDVRARHLLVHRRVARVPGTGWVRRRERRDGRGRRRASSRGRGRRLRAIRRVDGARHGGARSRRTRAVERAGVGAFTPEQGLAALAAIVRRAPSAVVAVSAFDWKTLARNVQPLPPACARRAEAEIREAEIREADAARTTDDRDSASATATIVDANAPSEAEIRSFVTRVVIDLTGNREVAPDEPLMSAGLDSLAGGQLKSAVDAAFSVRLPPPPCTITPPSPRSHRSCAGKWAARASIARLEARRTEARRTSRISRRGNRSRRPVARWR